MTKGSIILHINFDVIMFYIILFGTNFDGANPISQIKMYKKLNKKHKFKIYSKIFNKMYKLQNMRLALFYNLMGRKCTNEFQFFNKY